LSVINESTAKATAFWVAPALRRQGIGSALLAESLRLAKSTGHARLLIRMPGAADSEGFAQARGGRPIEQQRMSGLELSTVDRRTFEEWAAPDAGYALVRWSDRCPDDLAASYCAARSAMADAPGAAHTTPLTVAALREKEQGLLRLGIHRHVQAVVAEDGDIAGFTDTVTVEGEPETAEVWNTAVVRAHRGRGLALRVKAAATLWMLREYPRISWIRTFNHEVGTPMLRVNRTLGYQPLVDWLTFEFDVA
jgi:GNAT superfamily N-acetyltransferase